MNIETDFYQSKSAGEFILEQDMPRWKKWALRNLLPAEFWTMPPQKIAKINKGQKIGSISVQGVMMGEDVGSPIVIGGEEDSFLQQEPPEGMRYVRVIATGTLPAQDWRDADEEAKP